MHFHKYGVGLALLALAAFPQLGFAGLTNLPACQAANDQENLFSAYLYKGDAEKEIEQHGCEKERGAFLMGVKQGIGGERFGFFYASGADYKDDQDFLRRHFACSEYGVPVEANGSIARFDSLLQKSTFEEYFVKPIGSLLMEAGKAILNTISSMWGRLFGNEVSVGSLRKELKKAEDKARADREQNKALRRADPVLAKKHPREAGSEQAYACCMRGFMQGAGALGALIKKTGNNDCYGFSARCKMYFLNGAKKAEIACQPDGTPCSSCDIRNVDKETKPKEKEDGTSLLGCASLGYLETLRTSPECQTALAKQRQVQTAQEAEKSNKNLTAAPVAPGDSKKSAGSATSAVGGGN